LDEFARGDVTITIDDNIHDKYISNYVVPGTGYHKFLSDDGVTQCIVCCHDCWCYCVYGSNNNVCVDCYMAELTVPTKDIENDIATLAMRDVLCEISYDLTREATVGEIIDLFDALVTKQQHLYGKDIVDNITFS
jgi:hypothetical protein